MPASPRHIMFREDGQLVRKCGIGKGGVVVGDDDDDDCTGLYSRQCAWTSGMLL